MVLELLTEKISTVFDKEKISVGEPVEVNGSHHLIQSVEDQTLTLIDYLGRVSKIGVDQVELGKVKISKVKEDKETDEDPPKDEEPVDEEKIKDPK